MKVAIIGAGYAGLNAYYSLKGRSVEIISEGENFTFYTNSYLQDKIARVDFVRVSKVTEVDLKDGSFKAKQEEKPDVLIVAVGCNHTEQLKVIRDYISKGGCISSETKYDEYMAIQSALYLSKRSRAAKYHGEFMKWLGRGVDQKLSNFLERNGVDTCESPSHVIPQCNPNLFDEFIPVNSYLMHGRTFVIGDIADYGPKLGELSMRMGIHVGREISHGLSRFIPIYIHMFQGKKRGLRIVSDVPWGGRKVIVRESVLYNFMKSFINVYYPLRKGRMGFLVKI
ncbi:hypothetical protein HS7_00730 [Sulfolobales archaeon HS-7]|nr:hypothetical protein HS7_00730 [Sulfolobales archaeon HS-7]